MIAPGVTVSEGQAVMELETDKAVVEVPSSVSGTVKDVLVKQGEKIKVGQTIFTVENGAGAKRGEAETQRAAVKSSNQNPAPVPAASKSSAEHATAVTSESPTSRVPSETIDVPEFKLPELGENIHQGDLVRLMVRPGA